MQVQRKAFNEEKKMYACSVFMGDNLVFKYSTLWFLPQYLRHSINAFFGIQCIILLLPMSRNSLKIFLSNWFLILDIEIWTWLRVQVISVVKSCGNVFTE